MNAPASPLRRKLARQAFAMAFPVLAAPLALAQFSQTGAGPYDYNDTANWTSGVINNTFTTNPVANQTVTFGVDTTLSGSLSIANTGTFSRTFRGEGANRTLTLGGSLSLGSTGNANTNVVTLGSVTEGQKLNLNLGGTDRTVFVGTNRTLDVLNAISGGAGIDIIKTGAGTLRLSGINSDFVGGLSIGASNQSGGTVEVVKLADTGAPSSIGSGAGNIGFGGTSTGTLRYIGSGDSTNRGLLIGGLGAIIDASGTGAIKFTNSAGQTNGSTGSARTFTLTGTNTADNTMSASFADAGTGGTVTLHKQGSGRWILAGNNSYTGNTLIDAGTLELGAANRIGNSSNLVLNGGTFATGGFSETLGTLDLNGSATIDFGAGDSDLVFADSSAVAWGASISLSLLNFTEGVDSIRFGTTALGLTEAQIGQIRINGLAATIGADGFLSVSAIPEPSAFAGFAGAAGLLAAGLRRRRRAA